MPDFRGAIGLDLLGMMLISMGLIRVILFVRGRDMDRFHGQSGGGQSEQLGEGEAKPIQRETIGLSQRASLIGIGMCSTGHMTFCKD